MVPAVTTSADAGNPYQAFDALSMGFGVVREGRLVHANAALLRLVGRPADEVVGQAGTAHLAGTFAESMRERHEARLRGEAVPDTYETSLRTPEGERRVEVSVSVQGPDTVFLVRDVTDRAGHRATLQRLAELGAALPSARTEEEVLQRVFAGLAELGLTFAWLVPQGERLRVERHHIAPALAADAQVVAALGGEGDTGSRTPPLMHAWREGVVFEEDFAQDLSRFVEAERAGSVRTAVRRAGELRVIAVRIDVEGAPRALLAVIAPWLREEELAPLRLFGAQVSAALGAVRTISRLSAQNTALAALNRLASVATTAPEPSALFEPGAREISLLLGCDALALYLRSEERNEVELVHGLGMDEATRALFARLSAGEGLSGRDLQEGVPVVLEAQSCPPYSRESLLRLGYTTLVVTPLRVRSRIVGSLALAFRQRRELSALERETLQAMGSHFAAATESHRLLREVRGRAEHLALIHEVGRSLVGTLELERLLEAGVTALARIVEAPDSYVMLLEDEGQRLVIRAVTGGHPGLLGYSVGTGPEGKSLATLALRAREVLLVEDGRTDPRVNQEVRARAEGIAYLVLPLVVHAHPVGVAVISDPRQPRRFTPAEVERASAIANQLALALEGARLVEDLKKSYAELQRTQQQLVESKQLAALGELSAVVAHEVRNPLGAIFNSVATLRRVLGPQSPAMPLLDIVGEESERLNSIVDDLLHFARPASPSPQPVGLERLLEESVRGALADATGTVEVEWTLEPNVPPVPVDERMMRQAFLNLALNAVQAMPHGGVLRVGVRRAAGTRPGVEVEFTDTGLGIAPETLARIFEPFFTTKAKGTGLGLALVKRIVESHDGRLSVDSPPGRGTTFRLFLPRVAG